MEIEAYLHRILRNNYFLTNLFVDTFKMYTMTRHIIRHHIREFKRPSRSLKESFDRMQCDDTEKTVIHFAEKTDTHIRNLLVTKVTALSRGKISIRQPYKSIFTGNFVTPCLHGGVTAALLEHTAQCCARTVTEDKNIVTENLRMDYLAPAPCFTDIIADAEVVGECSGSVWVDVVCWNHSRTTKVALGRVKMSVPRPTVVHIL